MSTPTVEPLAPLLLERLRAHLDSTQERHRLTLRNFLTGNSKWLNRSKVACEVNDWILDVSSSESLPLRQRMVDVLRNKQTTLDSLYTPIVLAWGFSQEWAGDIDVKGVVERWATANAPPRDTTMRSCFAATSFLDQLSALKTFFPEPLRAKAFADVAHTMFTCTSEWDPIFLPTTGAGRFFTALGGVVHAGAGMQRDSTLLLSEQWASTCARLAQATDTPTQMGIAHDIMHSDLPAYYKMLAHKNVNPKLWMMSYDMFNPLLPSDEVKRFEWLPFERLYTPVEEMVEPLLSMHNEQNSNLVQRYCPELHPFLALAATPQDWCARERIQAWVDRFASDHAAAQPSLPLPAGLDESGTLNH